MKRLIAFLAVIILITAASAVFSAETLLLSDNFNIADNVDVNTDLVSRQSGILAGTTLSDNGGSGTATIAGGALRVSGRHLNFNQDFSRYSLPGKSIHYSFKLKNNGYYGYIWIASTGDSYSNGGRGLGVQESGGTSYIDCTDSPAGHFKEVGVGNDGAFHQWDLYVTQQVGYKDVVVKKDSTVVYTTQAQDPWWSGLTFNMHCIDSNVMEIDDVAIYAGSDVALTPDAQVLLSDNFNVAGGSSNINADIAARQSGVFATTKLTSTNYAAASIDPEGFLKLTAGTTAFAKDFNSYFALGSSIHYSFNVNAASSWTTIHISSLFRGFENGGPGLGLELSGGTYYIDSFNALDFPGWDPETASYKGYKGANGSLGSAGWHHWDVQITQQLLTREIVIKADGIQIYNDTTDSTPGDTYWTGGALNINAASDTRIDDVVITGTPDVEVPPAATGYIASGRLTGSGITILQANGGNERALIGTNYQVYGVSFAPNGDLYFTQEYQPGVYKAAYMGGNSWGDAVLYASIPSGGYYYGAYNLTAKSDGTVFVGTYASDEIYRIDPNLTVTKIVGAGLSGNWGWQAMAITPEGSTGIPGALWTLYQRQYTQNYTAAGATAGFNCAQSEVLQLLTFAHGKLYTAEESTNTIYEVDPNNPATRSPYITGFQGTTNVIDYVNTGGFGADANGDGYGDFYLKHNINDGRGSAWVMTHVISVYSGDPALASGARYLYSYDQGVGQFAIDVYPKGTQDPFPSTAVTGVTLNKSTLTLDAGSSETLVATISPNNATNKAITWSASNSKATVSATGLVTGVSGGTCTIRATTADGGFYAECVVTINAPLPEPPTGTTLLTDSFEAGGATSDLNTILSTRQSGTFAPTPLSTNAWDGTASISADGKLQLGFKMAFFTSDFADFSNDGYTHYSFKMNSISGWNYAHISDMGRQFGNGGPGLGIEISGGTWYIDSFNESHAWKGKSGSFSGGMHQWDVYITQKTATREIIVKLDGSRVYEGTTDSVPNDTYWTGGFLNFQSNSGNSAEYNDVVITGSKTAIPAAIGYIATGAGGGIKILQTNGGYQRALISAGEITGISFAPSGDIYYTYGNYNVYKSVYNGNGLWSPGTIYATLPSGYNSSYCSAFSLAAKDDGTVFVGTYASDDIYRIDPDLTVTLIVDAATTPPAPELGWWDMEISPSGVDGAFWAVRQNIGMKNYNANGSDAGFNLASGYDYIRGSAFANGKYYAHGASYTEIFEYDPTDSASGVSFIDFTTEFALGTLSDYIGGGAYGADFNGDTFSDFYFKHFVLDSNNGYVCLVTEILVYSGAPGLTPTTRFLGKIESGDMWHRGMDTFPKGNESAPPMPTMNYSDDIVVDGDLSDWADATFTPMNVAYYPTPSVNLDISNAAFAHKWGAGGTKVYFALKVQDTDPIRNDWYTYWNANDHVETQLWASSTLSGENDQNICNKFQQYEFGLMENGISNWSYMCGAGDVPDFANFTYSVKEIIDGWVYYEAAMTPFEAFSRLDVNEVVARTLAVDDVVGADAVIASNNNWADFNMVAADGNVGKSANTSKILKQKLVREGVMGSIDLQNYDGTKLGIAGTATITDGTNTEIHNIVLDTAGLYSFATALRGDCTVIVKCSHWLGKSASVTVPSTGNVVVALLSIINGDVVESNEVDFDDINATRAAYGSFPGDENWNARADVDGTGEVDFSDINIVRGKYGEIGE